MDIAELLVGSLAGLAVVGTTAVIMAAIYYAAFALLGEPVAERRAQAADTGLLILKIGTLCVVAAIASLALLGPDIVPDSHREPPGTGETLLMIGLGLLFLLGTTYGLLRYLLDRRSQES